MPFHIWAGLAVWGSGFLVGALGLVFLAITVGLCGFVIPKLFQGIGWLFRKCFHRKKSLNATDLGRFQLYAQQTETIATPYL